MESLLMCEKLERAVGERNWLDIMIVYFDDYASGQRDFARRLNWLVGEMNEVCEGRVTFVQELQNVAGETMPVKVVVFLEEMMNKEGSREYELHNLEKEAKETICEIEFFVGKEIAEDIRLAREINALCMRLTTVVDEREAFADELDMLAQKYVPGKMAEFTKRVQSEDIANLMKLKIVGREFELRAQENELFIKKLKAFSYLSASLGQWKMGWKFVVPPASFILIDYATVVGLIGGFAVFQEDQRTVY
ncbi:hypothetical protein Tco_1240858 [Tanacetum coccineum]